MKINEIYNKTIIEDFWNKLGEELVIDEAYNGLTDLLNKADRLIFDKFKINPKEKRYCIVGSARLYLYPKLREAFGLEGTIGDLDILIPYKEDWVKAGLEKEWNNGGIYRPTDDGSIEAFNVWDPSRAGGAYADVSVRSTKEIMRDATLINGYYYMSLYDIIDYKSAMNRNKEIEVVNLIKRYQKSNVNNRQAFLKRMVELIGLNDTKKFLGKVKD